MIRGRIGSIFTAQQIPESLNLFITLKSIVEGRVQGSNIRQISSLQVVIDYAMKQLCLYCLSSCRSLDIGADYVNT